MSKSNLQNAAFAYYNDPTQDNYNNLAKLMETHQEVPEVPFVGAIGHTIHRKDVGVVASFRDKTGYIVIPSLIGKEIVLYTIDKKSGEIVNEKTHTLSVDDTLVFESSFTRGELGFEISNHIPCWKFSKKDDSHIYTTNIIVDYDAKMPKRDENEFCLAEMKFLTNSNGRPIFEIDDKGDSVGWIMYYPKEYKKTTITMTQCNKAGDVIGSKENEITCDKFGDVQKVFVYCPKTFLDSVGYGSLANCTFQYEPTKKDQNGFTLTPVIIF